MRILRGVLLAAALVAGAATAGTPVDPNFNETTFVSDPINLSLITGLAWAPDNSNRLFVIRKEGEVRIIENGQLRATPFFTFNPVFTNSECGLIGICFDPNYATNRFIYFFVTVSSSEQQIIRLTDGNSNGANQTVILSGLPTKGNNHDGGGIGVGPDGKLYFSIGDLGDGTGVDADLTTLASKVGRANLDGSLPSDNPFADGQGPNNDYIWARGFRNPFTLAFQPGTGKLWLNVTGGAYEQVFVVNASDHGGWNDFENNQPAGFIPPTIKYRNNGFDTRTLAANGAARASNVTTYTTTEVHGFRLGEKISVSGVGVASFNGSFFVASIPSPTTFTVAQTGSDETSGGGSARTQGIGGALVGGCFYEGTLFPAGFQGNFFFGDFVSGRLMRSTFNLAGDVSSVDEFVTGISSLVDVAVGTDGALYYAGVFDGIIYRVAPRSTSGDDFDADGIVDAVDTDDDNDGVSDANEALDGTNPLDAVSLVKKALVIDKFVGAAKFTITDKDTATLSARIADVGAGLAPEGIVASIDIAGAKITYTLDKRGAAKAGKSTFSAKFKPTKKNVMTGKPEFVGGELALKAKIVGTFTDDWANEGVTSADAKDAPVTFAVELVFGGRVYAGTVALKFSSRGGKSGTLKK